jgi:hypothetical protein
MFVGGEKKNIPQGLKPCGFSGFFSETEAGP